MKHIKNFKQYESLAGVGTDINNAIKNASELVGKDLTEKDVILELRDNIEISLQKGDDDMADVLTDIKFELETLLK
jgi:DNA-binding ferritin-like protein